MMNTTQETHAPPNPVDPLASHRASGARRGAGGPSFAHLAQRFATLGRRLSSSLLARRDTAKRREIFLAQADAIFQASLDDSTTLEQVARLAVPLVADWCTVDLLDAAGRVQPVIVAHADPARLAYVDDLRRRYPLDPSGPHPVMHVLRTGEPVLLERVPAALLEAMAVGPEHLEMMRALAMRSGMVVPLKARGRTLGAIAFAFAESGRRYCPDDFAMAEELARRCALQIDNARLYRQAQVTAERHRESVALLDTLLTAAPVGFAFLDEHLCFAGFNDAMAKMAGLVRSMDLGRELREALPDIAAQVESALRRVLLTGQPIIDFEVHHQVQPGVKKNWLANFFPVRPEGGKTLGIGAVLLDITDRTRAEEAVARHQAHIEALNERLQRAMTETHHRVKNNLQIITAMMDMWLIGSGESVPLTEVRRLGRQIQTLTAVHDILTQEAKEDGQAHRFSAKAVLETLLPMLQEAAPGRRIEAEIAEVRLSSRQGTSLALVTNELISNALKYSGGDVRVRLTAQDDAAVLEISDEGPGFRADFDPGRIASTGLELVENLSRWDLDGQTHYENLPQGGARVTVTMPIGNAAMRDE